MANRMSAERLAEIRREFKGDNEWECGGCHAIRDLLAEVDLLTGRLQIAKDALGALKAGVEMILREKREDIGFAPGTVACIQALADICEEPRIE